MTQQRYKRFRMELDFRFAALPTPVLPDGYCWLAWRPILSERHSQVKWRAFREDLDGRVFTCLSEIEGCRRLISDIGRQPQFCSEATWLVAFQPEPSWPADDCGTIQGIRRAGGMGSIQNVGIVPEHRGNGLGKAIVLKSLAGFQQQGLTHASLEVTALNRVAVGLYQSLGFRITRVLYREGEGGKVIQGTERAPLKGERELITTS
ncbi:MAG: GNAT family N-acetyltransferase [Fuerstiella sp.]|nr:GNAT family N-acetyltransferase [Fuerstiella sp.]MCP4505244.1 GNAT family N-acetyltransferase [Fuerstiella sp.]